MGSDGLHQAAKKKRARDHEASEAARKAAAAAPAAAARQKRARAREALAEAGGAGAVVTIGLLVVGMLGPILAAVLILNGDNMLVIFGAAIVSMIGAFLGYALGQRIMATIRRARLATIGRGLDVAGYLDQLGENRSSAVVVVRVRFAREWPEEGALDAPDAVAEWMPSLAKTEWEVDGQVLVLRSASISGRLWASSKYGSSHYFDNKDMHGCFLKIVSDVLPRLEQVAPIAKLEVELEGSVLAWDATA